MDNQIVIRDGIELVGISNIVVSEIDGKIFINNTNQIESGIKGSLGVYTQDGQELGSTGLQCVWNETSNTLEVYSLKAEQLALGYLKVSDLIDTRYIKVSDFVESRFVKVSEFIETPKLSVDNWFGFKSKVQENQHPFKIKIRVNPDTNTETLCFITNEYSNTTSKIAFALDDERVCINNYLNLKPKTVTTSEGCVGDASGDVAVDENYFYYCIKNFDGTSKIWRRCEMKEW
jgi:hypothetical protein